MASGYALFERLSSEEIGQGLEQVQAAVTELDKFGKCVKLTSLLPFKNAADALQNCNDVSEGMPGGYGGGVGIGIGRGVGVGVDGGMLTVARDLQRNPQVLLGDELAQQGQEGGTGRG